MRRFRTAKPTLSDCDDNPEAVLPGLHAPLLQVATLSEVVTITGTFGAGKNGAVLAGVLRDDDHPFAASATNAAAAVKVLATDSEFAMLEIATMSRLAHPHVGEMLAAVRPLAEPERLYMVMPAYERTLHQCIWGHDPPAPAEAERIIGDVAAGLAYLHAEGVIHRDVKPDNIMCDAGGAWRLIDLGNAYCAPIMQPTPLSTDQGSACYRAPELVMHDTGYGPAVDLWALGCVIWEACAHSMLFDVRVWSRREIARVQALVLGPPSETEWPGVSRLPNFADITAHLRDLAAAGMLPRPRPFRVASPRLDALMARLLKYNPALRPAAATVARGLAGPAGPACIIPPSTIC